LAFLKNIIVTLLVKLVEIIGNWAVRFIEKQARISQAKDEIIAQTNQLKVIGEEIYQLEALLVQAQTGSDALRVKELHAEIESKEKMLRDVSARIEFGPDN
jgi:hypothetical protein